MATRARARAPSRHGAAPRPRPWTRADLTRLPDDGNRYEVLEGALLVTPQASFPHQRIAAALIVRLDPYCERHCLGVVVGPGAVPKGKSELQPDVQVIPGSEAQLSRDWARLPRPLVVVEVLSEGSRRFDMGKKRDAYLAWKVGEYWMADLESRTITVARTGHADKVCRERLVWRPAGASEPLILDVVDLFRRAVGS